MTMASEREAIAVYLERRATFWMRWPACEWVARALRNEAIAIRSGEFLNEAR